MELNDRRRKRRKEKDLGQEGQEIKSMAVAFGSIPFPTFCGGKKCGEVK
jgi:hypothetical protein